MKDHINIIILDPEWVVAAKCPDEKCKSISFACCQDHLVEAVNEHIAETH